MSFSVPAPASHRSVVLLAPFGEVVAEAYSIRTVIQFSICPSISSQREGPKINPLCKIVWTMSITAKRAGTQHIKSAGENLSPYLWWNYVPALLFRNLECLLFPFRRQTLQWNGAAAIPFGSCLVFHFRYSVVGSAMRVEYSIAYRTLVRQEVWSYAVKNLKIFQKQ